MANTDAHQYLYNEEGELVVAWVAQNSTANNVGVYSFDSSGQRVRSDNPTAQTWREYTYFNGQVVAEKDNTGNWTDHIYANGKRIASVRPTIVLHHSGVCGNCNGGSSNFFVPQLASELQGYTLRPGDKLLFQQKQTNARAGLYMYATDGTNSMCGLVDQNGDCLNSSSQADGTWKTRLVDLSSWAGKQISTNLGVSVEANTPQGVMWDSQIGDVSIVSTDGQVHTMFHGQATGGTAWSPGAGSSFSTLALNTTPSGSQAVQISFPNDACSCTNTAQSGDRNLFVTQVASGGNLANLSTSGGATYDTCGHDNGNLYCSGSMFVTVPYGGPLTVRAHGTLADGVAPHMQVRVNGNLLGEFDVPEAEQTYTFNLANNTDTAVLTTYFAGDQVGTTQMEFANDAWPVQRTEFAPFGQELSNPGLSSNRYKFTGKERDTESGLDYFGARYYGSGMGRFMSPDWSVSPDPIPYADIKNPQTLNLYSYSGNNPLSNVDSDGHTYHICDQNGQNCSDVSDKEFDQIAKNARSAGESWSNGNIKLADGSAGGSFKQTDVDLAGDPSANQAAFNMMGNGSMGLIKEFVVQSTINVVTEGVGQGIGLAIDAARAARAAEAAEAAARTSQVTVKLGAGKPATKWANQLLKRGWTESEIADAIANGKSVSATNNINPANGATRYISPTSGKSVVVDNVTQEVIHVGGSGFQY